MGNGSSNEDNSMGRDEEDAIDMATDVSNFLIAPMVSRVGRARKPKVHFDDTQEDTLPDCTVEGLAAKRAKK